MPQGQLLGQCILKWLKNATFKDISGLSKRINTLFVESYRISIVDSMFCQTSLVGSNLRISGTKKLCFQVVG
jgi:hypothetical protein